MEKHMPQFLSAILAHWPHWPWLAPLLAILLAFEDRDVGDGSEHGLSRSWAMAAIIIGGGAIAGLAFGPWWSFLGLFFAVWRSISYGGAMDPQTSREAVLCTLRYCLWFLPAIPVLRQPGDGGVILAAAVALAILIAIASRLEFGRDARRGKIVGDPEARCERLEGAVFGLAFAVYALYQVVVTSA